LFLAAVLEIRVHAFIFEVHSIKKSDHTKQGPEWVIGLGDLHDKKHPSSESQKKAIQHFLASLPKGQVKVLTEDLSSPAVCGRKGCGNFYINSRGGVLGGFTQDCKTEGLSAENHEFRFCRVSSLGPVLNDTKADVASLVSTNTIKMADIHSEVQKEIDRIRSFNDGDVLTNAYDQNISETQKMLKKLRIMPDDQTSVAHYLKKNVSQDNRINFIKGMLTFDSELFDCKLAHAIKQEKDKKYMVIIAGGAHVKRVCDMLMKDGYHQHAVVISTRACVCDTQKCIRERSRMYNTCAAPQAIDLSCLPDCCAVKK